MAIPIVINFILFEIAVIGGIAGTLILTLIIVGYTVFEFRRREIW